MNERRKAYNTGKNHQRFKHPPFLESVEYKADYLDGYHGRNFGFNRLGLFKRIVKWLTK